MRIYKKFILIILLTHLPIFGQQISKSIKLLDEVSNQMSSYKNFEFEFKYSLENSKENIRQETFGKIIINLTDYLLTPPFHFTSNMDWPATDTIYEHDHDYLDALFFLNSNKFYYCSNNNSKRDCYYLICDLTLEPLFLAK